MKKLILLFNVIIIFSSISYATECDSIIFNSGAGLGKEYTLSCESAGADNLCPADYSNWGTCRDNFDGNKCFPCDPDCGACLAMDVFGFKTSDCPDIPFDVTVRLYAEEGKGANVIMRNNADNPEDFASCIVATGESYCDVILSDSDGISSTIAGEFESDGKYTYDFIAAGDFFTTKEISGFIGPKITITCPGGASCDNIDINNLKGDVGISVSTGYPAGKTMQYEYKIKKKSSASDYTEINVEGNVGHCGWCPEWEKNCNLLKSEQQTLPTGSSAEWDTTVCDNNDFQIIVDAYDTVNRENSVCSDSINVKTNNEVPGVPGRPNVLNLMIARVKSWM